MTLFRDVAVLMSCSPLRSLISLGHLLFHEANGGWFLKLDLPLMVNYRFNVEVL